MQEITIALGTTLKEWRRINKKSQRQVAELIGFNCSQSQITKFERGLPVREDMEFQISKFVQNHCLNEQRSDALNAKREPDKKEEFENIPDLKEQLRDPYEKILEWLYTKDEAFDTKLEWRKAFVAFLKEVL